jgi:TPR repeat protein
LVRPIKHIQRIFLKNRGFSLFLRSTGVSYSKESTITSVAPDPLLAFHYFQASAAGGYAPAVEALSRLQSVSELSQQRTQTDMLEMFAQRSESPSPSICFEIGRRFAVGLGQSADVSSAIQWYQRAVDAASTALSDHSLLSTISPDATVLCGSVFQERKLLYENGQKVHQRLIDAALQEIAKPRPEPSSSEAVAVAAEIPNELPEGCVPEDSLEGAGEPSEMPLPLLDLPADSLASAAVYVRTEASFALGRLLDQPEGPASPIKSPAQHVLRRDSAAALRHLQVAAQYWHAGAMQQVAVMYEDGRGADCERDTAAALIWYARAAKHGSELAHDRLTSLMSQKIADQMIKAVSGDSEAVYQIANKLDEGDDNMPKSQRISLQWYERALELGNAAAANNLGVLYDNGKGVERCAVKAVQYFTQSAELGSQWAMKNLGIIYEYGRDGLIPRSLTDAVKWYHFSCGTLIFSVCCIDVASSLQVFAIGGEG